MLRPALGSRALLRAPPPVGVAAVPLPLPSPPPSRCRAPPPRATDGASSSRGGASTAEDVAPLSVLQAQLAAAIAAEDYAAAARLRDQVHAVEKRDPLRSLELELDRAVAEERYGDAARLRDQLSEMRPPPPPPSPEPEASYDASAALSSSKTTEGINVRVESFFVPAQSRPAAGSYLFAYRIRIKNVAHPTTVKLVARRWLITDALGRTHEVRGRGVVGEEPELAPGEEFVYESAVPLRTERGTMEGAYEFYSRVSPADQWTTSFLVDVARFGLSTEGPKRM